eukprot:gi/632991396/ref/XP_007884607.1/ PREDICTED: cathepsin L1-like [Callorhinchus milii]
MNFKLGKTSFSLSLNALADLNDEERKGRFLRNTNTMAEEDRPRLVLEADVESVTAIKPSVDWRDTDRVTSVKTQGSCGACYAFSAIGAIEGQLVKAGKSLKSLSVQQIIDCSNKTWGCAGGFQTIVFKYAKDQVIVSNDVYPYSGKKEDCKLNNQMSGVQVKSFKWVPNDEVKLAEAVGRIGPISINADSNHNSFFFTVEEYILMSNVAIPPTTTECCSWGTDQKMGRITGS